MARNKAWKSRWVKPSEPHLHPKSTEELACELVNLLKRKNEANQRLKLLLKHSVGALADEDFIRMESEATGCIAKTSRAITDLKTELKRRGIML